MTRLCSILLVLLVFPSLVAPCSAQESEWKSPLAKLDLKDGDSIVFLGDSITHQCLYTQYVEDYFYTRFPKMRLRIHNAGVGGAQAWDALERFDRDVAAYKPKYVTVLLGMNDGRYRPFDTEIFQTYHKDMSTLVSRIVEAGATPILMSPTMFDARARRMRKGRASEEMLEQYNAVLAYYGSWLRDVAAKSGFGYVDMYSPLNSLTLEARKKDPSFTMIRDSVHPGAPGQVVMAFSIVNQMGLPRSISNIRILPGKNGKSMARASGGKVTDLVVTEDRVEFTWAAVSLPWVVPEEAQLGADLTKLGHKMSREALEVHGLKSGRYQLSIDGTIVGNYLASALERHVELQQNSKTPQYQQSMRVAELNKSRNSGSVRSLRGEWSLFQRWARMNAVAKTEADKTKVAAAAKRLEGREERIKQFEAAAKSIEDEIFELNQPQPRRYVLSRVE